MTALDVARALPGISAVRDRCRALAMLDAIMAPGSPHLRHTYDAAWAPGRELAAMDNGSGDEYSIVFSPAGAFVRGFDHESPMSPYQTDSLWPGLVDTVPAVFADSAAEPAFSDEDFDMIMATSCLWREPHDDRWHTGDISYPEGSGSDGADWMFGLLTDPTPESYVDFAEGYWERELDVDAVRQVCALTPLTPELVQRLNPAVSPADLDAHVTEIGYPVG